MLIISVAMCLYQHCHFVDIDECQEGVTNNCTQGCARDSISGGHQCSCGLGYDLVGGTTCEGIYCNKRCGYSYI